MQMSRDEFTDTDGVFFLLREREREGLIYLGMLLSGRAFVGVVLRPTTMLMWRPRCRMNDLVAKRTRGEAHSND